MQGTKVWKSVLIHCSLILAFLNYFLKNYFNTTHFFAQSHATLDNIKVTGRLNRRGTVCDEEGSK